MRRKEKYKKQAGRNASIFNTTIIVKRSYHPYLFL